MNVAGQIEAMAICAGWLGRTAFVVDGIRHTHGDVHRLAATFAVGLAERGVTRGDRVLLALPDGIELVASFLAAARLGAVSVIVNPELTASDHRAIVDDCTPRMVVAETLLHQRFPGRQSVSPAVLTGRVAGVVAPVEVGAGDPLYVQYTSGTTGRPKGAVHAHGHPAAYHRCIGQGVFGIGPDDVLLSVSKLYFAYGFGNALVFPLFTGASAVLFADRPPATDVRAAVRRHGVTLLFAVPGFYAKLLDAGPAEGPGVLRAAVSAGERLLPALGTRLSQALAVPVLEQIGSTEAGHAFCANGIRDNVSGTVGPAVPEFELALRASGGGEVADGEIGELWIRGPTVMSGYLGRPDETAAVLRDGWLNTRDRMSRNTDGTYAHHGRSDDIEVVGGINVAPLEVEAVLGRHPGVREVAVVSVTDGTGVTALRAFVVPATAAVAPHDLEQELIALARANLARFKVPKSVRLVAELPRTHTGKLRRFLLRTPSAPEHHVSDA